MKDNKKKFQGIWIPAALWETEDLTIREMIFLVEINALDNDNGCFASNAHFAKFMRLTNSRCSQIISSLKKKEFITIDLIYEGKEVKKRIIKVASHIELGSKYTNWGSKDIKEGVKYTNEGSKNIKEGIKYTNEGSKNIDKVDIQVSNTKSLDKQLDIQLEPITHVNSKQLTTVDENELLKIDKKKENEENDFNIRLDILNYFCELTGKHIGRRKEDRGYQTNHDILKKVFKFNMKPTAAEIKAVIKMKFDEWIGTEQEKYIRPATLFNKTKFSIYWDALNDEPKDKKDNLIIEMHKKWYLYQFGLNYASENTDTRAAIEIEKKLKELNEGDIEDNWRAMLISYPKWGEWQREQKTLVKINNNFNDITNNSKNGRKGNKENPNKGIDYELQERARKLFGNNKNG